MGNQCHRSDVMGNQSNIYNRIVIIATFNLAGAMVADGDVGCCRPISLARLGTDVKLPYLVCDNAAHHLSDHVLYDY